MFHSSLHSVSSDFFSFPPIFRSLHFLRSFSFFSSFFLTLFFILFLFLLIAFIISFLTSTCSPSTHFPISFLHLVAFLYPSFFYSCLRPPSPCFLNLSLTLIPSFSPAMSPILIPPPRRECLPHLLCFTGKER